MSTYFVFSDIHGFFDEWQKALNEAGFNRDNSEHILISCGDAIDRGPKSKEVLQFLVDMSTKNRAILIRGNHCDLMEEAIIRGYFKGHDIHNMTTDTACQLTDIEDPDKALVHMKDCELWKTYVNKCVDYAEVGKNIFVHGWIPCFDKWCSEFMHNYNWRKAAPYMWKKARWLNGMSAWHNGYGIKGKTIWCGHWHSSWGHANLHDDGIEFVSKIETFYIDEKTGNQEPHSRHDPFKDKGIVAMDACTVISGLVNCEVLEV